MDEASSPLYVALCSANRKRKCAHQKDFFEITFGETRLSENGKTYLLNLGENCMARMEFQISCSANPTTNSETTNSICYELLISDQFEQVFQVLFVKNYLID